jgi:putative DNA primase/helicase
VIGLFFKGYVETKDKKCIEKFKNRTDFKTFEQVQSLPEFAGILATDTILVDIDDSESSELLFKVVKEYSLCCRVYKTSRGKHFLFKNSGVPTNKTGCKLAIGITADIKIGTRNSYSVLKYGGVEREILYDTAENEEAQPLPRWLHPVKSKMEFLNMDAGDGRNQSLFNYILTLQSNDFTVEEARETIRIINKFVLKVPLSDDEIETILRDDAFKKPVFLWVTRFCLISSQHSLRTTTTLSR